MNPQEPERQAAQCTLSHRHQNSALHRRSRDICEASEKLGFLIGTKWYGGLDGLSQRFAVTQQEEQKIQHHTKSDQEVERVHSDIDRLRSERLSALHQT